MSVDVVEVCSDEGAMKQLLQGLCRAGCDPPCSTDHFTALGRTQAQLAALLFTYRQQPSNLKSLPQFSASVKTPALMMDVASLCEPMVG